MFSPIENNIFRASKSVLYMDMDQPLTHYFI